MANYIANVPFVENDSIYNLFTSSYIINNIHNKNISLTLTKSNGEILRLSNRKIEDKNSYIKKMLKLANGYSSFDRFRNRAMYYENYYETYSEEKLSYTVKRIFPKKKDQLNRPPSGL